MIFHSLTITEGSVENREGSPRFENYPMGPWEC